jgi:ubiquinone/menaquinone biosynthesis C-methylase UbiE
MPFDLARPRRGPRRSIGRALQSKLTARLAPEQYRRHVRQHYDGPAGAFLAAASLLSLHSPLAGRFFRRAKFDTQGCRRILDLGSGAGQILKHLLRYAPAEAELYAVDLSARMLTRARDRLVPRRPKSPSHHTVSGARQRPSKGSSRGGRPTLRFVSADITHLPFHDATFDAITCGWVLEHLPDPCPGLCEMARVLVPGGRILLFTTEDTITGAMCSRTWKCRTYNRKELRQHCAETGLAWKSELWFSKLHRALGLGGILVEIQRRSNQSTGQAEGSSSR